MKTLKAISLSTIILIATCTAGLAGQLQTTVSIVPLKYFVKKIGGDSVKVNIMVKPGSSPATYEPQPRQMAELSKSEIYFAIGVPFEKGWLPRFKSANSKLEIVNLGEAVVHHAMKAHIHEDEEHGHNHDHSPHAEPGQADTEGHGKNIIKDPHIWLAPQLVRAICQEIRDTLIEHNPDNADLYTANFLRFAEEINNLDSELLRLFAKSRKHLSFMVYHPSWGYFARAYGLTQIPIELEGKEPSPKELATLIKFAKNNSVKAIFIQPQFSRKSAQAVASSIGAEVLIADPLSADWAANLLQTAKSFAKVQ